MLKHMILGLVVLAVSGLASSVARADGKAAYDKHCKKCHAEDGSGKNAKGEWLPVAKSMKLEKPETLSLLGDESKKATRDDIKKAITEGKGKMKGMKDKMTAEEIDQAADQTLTLQGRGK